MKAQYIRAMDAIHQACLFVAGCCLVIIVVIIPYGVFCRYALNSAASWPEPVAVLLMIILSFLSAVVCYREYLHIGVGVLPAFLDVLSDVAHDRGESAALQKDGAERDLQEALAAAPEALGEPLTLVRREWQTEIGPVDLMCHDEAGEWVAVEVKRVGTIEAVEQLTRYLDFIRRDPAKAGCRGILAAERLKPQAVALAESRDIHCVPVDLAVLRGEREPELTLFAA